MSIYGVSIDEQPKLRDRLNMAVQHTQKIQSFSNDMNDLKGHIDKINDKISRINDLSISKANKDDLIDLKTSINNVNERVSKLEAHLESLVDKDMFKQNLDEISACFEDFVLSSGNTPRVNFGDFEKRIAEIEQKLLDVSSQIQSQPKVNIRTAMDTEQQPTAILENSNSLFRKPERKK